jgi:NO-binding membrane sensor protein with MHYT domain
MRSVRLARIAAEAELLRLRLMGRRQAMRAVLGVVAAIFLLACLAALHLAGYQALLVRGLEPWLAALIVAGVDLVITLAFAALAMRDTPSRAEREALEVRKRAQLQLAEAVAVTALTGPILRMLGTRRLPGLALAALTARYFGARL